MVFGSSERSWTGLVSGAASDKRTKRQVSIAGPTGTKHSDL